MSQIMFHKKIWFLLKISVLSLFFVNTFFVQTLYFHYALAINTGEIIEEQIEEPEINTWAVLSWEIIAEINTWAILSWEIIAEINTWAILSWEIIVEINTWTVLSWEMIREITTWVVQTNILERHTLQTWNKIKPTKNQKYYFKINNRAVSLYTKTNQQKVWLTFSKLQWTEWQLLFTQEEISLNGKIEQAYTFEWDNFNDGDFAYTMTLPNPYWDNAVIMRRKNAGDDFHKITNITNNQDWTVSFSLDHFTTFVVTFNWNPAPTSTWCILLWWTWAVCFQNLQDAIDQAVWHQDTIYVYSWTYTWFTVNNGWDPLRNIDIIARAGVTIAWDVTINRYETRLVWFDDINWSIHINSDRVSLEDINVLSGVIIDWDEVVLDNIRMLNWWNRPMWIYHKQWERLQINNSRFKWRQSAIYLNWNDSDSIINNDFQENDYGIKLDTTDVINGLTIHENTFNNGVTRFGIYQIGADSLKNVSIKYNLFDTNKEWLHVTNIDWDFLVKSNEFVNNLDFAINNLSANTITADFNWRNDATWPDPIWVWDEISGTGNITVDIFATVHDSSPNGLCVWYDNANCRDNPDIVGWIEVDIDYIYYNPVTTKYNYVDGKTLFDVYATYSWTNPVHCQNSYTFAGVLTTPGTRNSPIWNVCTMTWLSRLGEPEGLTTIWIKLRDYFGLIGDENIQVVVDQDNPVMTQNPTIQFNYNATIHPWVLYTWWASDKVLTNIYPIISEEDTNFDWLNSNSPLRACNYRELSSASIKNWLTWTASPWKCTTNFASLISWDYNLQFTWEDRVWHIWWRWPAIDFTVDDENPTIEFSNIQTWTLDFPVQIWSVSITIEDNYDVLEAYYDRVDVWVSCTWRDINDFHSLWNVANRTSRTRSFNNTTISPYKKLCVRAFDLVYNQFDNEISPFYVDQESPTIQQTSPADTNKNCGVNGCPVISWTLDDNFWSGKVTKVRVIFEGVNYSWTVDWNWNRSATVWTLWTLIASWSYSNIELYAEDNAWNIWNWIWNLQIDTQAIVQLIRPINETFFNTGQNITFEAKCLLDTTNGKYCEEMQFQREYMDTNTLWAWWLKSVVSPPWISDLVRVYDFALEWEYEVWIRWQDAANNESISVKNTIYLDRTAPTVTIAWITGDNVEIEITERYLENYSHTFVTSTWACNSSVSFSNTVTVATRTNTTTWTIVVTTMSAHDKYLCIKAVDEAGNTSYTASTTKFNLYVPWTRTRGSCSVSCGGWTMTQSCIWWTCTWAPAAPQACNVQACSTWWWSSWWGSSWWGHSWGWHSWWWGGGHIEKDDCPDWDFSNSYYDDICGTKKTLTASKTLVAGPSKTYLWLIEIVNKYEGQKKSCTSVFPQFGNITFSDTNNHIYGWSAYDLLSKCAVRWLGNDWTKSYVPFGINNTVKRAEIIKMLVNAVLISQWNQVLLDSSYKDKSVLYKYKDMASNQRYDTYFAQAQNRWRLESWTRYNRGVAYLDPHKVASMKDAVTMIKIAAQQLWHDTSNITYYNASQLSRWEFATIVVQTFGIEWDYFFTSNASNNLLFLKKIAEQVELLPTNEQLPFLEKVYKSFENVSDSTVARAKMDKRSILKVLNDLLVKVGWDSKGRMVAVQLQKASLVTYENTPIQQQQIEPQIQQPPQPTYTNHQLIAEATPQVVAKPIVIQQPKTNNVVLSDVQTSMRSYKVAALKIEARKKDIKNQIAELKATQIELEAYHKLFTNEGQIELLKNIELDMQKVKVEIQKLSATL